MASGTHDQDRLLVSYDKKNTAILMNQYNALPSTAHHYDVTKDPATCSGNHGRTMHERLVHVLWVALTARLTIYEGIAK